MALDRLRSFFESLQDSFLSGELEATLANFSLPVVIYSVAGVTVLRNEAEFFHIAGQYRAAIIAKAVVNSHIEIVERDVAVGNRLRATVRAVDMNALGEKITKSLIRYFLVQMDDSYRIEMMEYLEAPLQLNEIERIIH